MSASPVTFPPGSLSGHRRASKPRVAKTGAGRGRIRFRSVSPGLWVGAALVVVLVLVALVGPSLVSISPTKQDLLHRLAPPVGLGGSWAHPLGTDSLGRDLLARLVAGARISLLIGALATVGSGAVGIVLGVLSAWTPRVVDRCVNWLIDVQSALPFVVVAIAATATLGNSVQTVLLTLMVTGWVGYARVTRAQARALRQATWVDAARSLGASDVEILRRHVLPLMVAPLLILATQQVSAMILYEAALSYLGLGVGGDTITWGRMAADGQSALFKAPWATIVPGAAVLLTVLGFNLLGDGLATRPTSGASGGRGIDE